MMKINRIKTYSEIKTVKSHFYKTLIKFASEEIRNHAVQMLCVLDEMSDMLSNNPDDQAIIDYTDKHKLYGIIVLWSSWGLPRGKREE